MSISSLAAAALAADEGISTIFSSTGALVDRAVSLGVTSSVKSSEGKKEVVGIDGSEAEADDDDDDDARMGEYDGETVEEEGSAIDDLRKEAVVVFLRVLLVTEASLLVDKNSDSLPPFWK